MSTKKRRSNAVTKALLITALASGIAGMQAQPVDAAYIQFPNTNIRRLQTVDNVDLSKSFYVPVASGNTTTLLFYSPADVVQAPSSYSTGVTFKGGVLYLIQQSRNQSSESTSSFSFDNYFPLGDAKSILGGSSSSGELSEEQKTIIKDLIANGPGLCRLVENFFERNDDNNEYEKKT